MMLFQSQFITIIAKSFITQLLFKSLIPIFVTNLKKKKKTTTTTISKNLWPVKTKTNKK